MPKQKFEQFSPKESMKIAKKFMSTKGNLKKLSKDNFYPGNLLFIKYDAKDKTKIYNKNPLVLILWSEGRHTLGINFHWLPWILRIELIRIILKLNESRANSRKPLRYSWHQLKAFLQKKRVYHPCIRKYINSRIFPRGYEIPNNQLLGFARLNMMIFSHGMSTEQVYAMAKNKKI